MNAKGSIMPRNQFGINLANTLYTAFRDAGGGVQVTLIRTTKGGRDPNDPTRRMPDTTTSHVGLCNISVGIRRIGNTRIPTNGVVIKVFSASIPGVTPELGDVLEVDGTQYTITEVAISGTAQTIYECICSR